MLSPQMSCEHPPSPPNFSHPVKHASPERAAPEASRRIPAQPVPRHPLQAPQSPTYEPVQLPYFQYHPHSFQKSAQLADNMHFQVPLFCGRCALFPWKPSVFNILTKTALYVFAPVLTKFSKRRRYEGTDAALKGRRCMRRYGAATATENVKSGGEVPPLRSG